jgi:hypothetical protein
LFGFRGELPSAQPSTRFAGWLRSRLDLQPMGVGKFEMWNADRGYGFIADVPGGKLHPIAYFDVTTTSAKGQIQKRSRAFSGI